MDPARLLDMIAADVMAAAPAAARAFVDRGMACVGCPFSRFETVAEAADAYGVDASSLAASLARAIADQPGGLPT